MSFAMAVANWQLVLAGDAPAKGAIPYNPARHIRG